LSWLELNLFILIGLVRAKTPGFPAAPAFLSA
jgi:hypothetical protein